MDSDRLSSKLTEKLVPILNQLIDTYPDSWQPKVYLGFLVDAKEPQRAEALFRDALKVSNSYAQLLAWGKRHPTLVKRLFNFALNRYKHSAYVIGARPDLGRDERRQIQREYYGLAREALGVAIGIDPHSEEIERKLAMTEGVVGDYETAYGRISRMIDSIESKGNQTRLGIANTRSKLAEPCHIQCQIAINWADDLRAQGSEAAAKKRSNSCNARSERRTSSWISRALTSVIAPQTAA